MLTGFRSFVAVAALACAAAGCDLVTDPDPLEDFQWAELTHGETVDERVDVTVVPGEIFILGELNTPTACYSLTADFDKNGSRLLLRISARSTNTPNCQPILGAYRYTAVLRHLNRGTYEFTVEHDVGGGDTREFTESVTIR